MKGTLRRTVSSGLTTALNRGLKRMIRRRVRLLAMCVVLSMLAASLPASSANTPELRSANGSVQSSSLPAEIYRGVSQSVASIGTWVAGIFTSTSPETIAYEPVAAYISPAPPFIDAPTNLSVTAAAAGSISLSWTAPGGSVDHYQIERATNVAGPFFFLTNVSSATTSHADNTVSNLQAYLYRVRAVTSVGLPSAPSNMALGTAISFQFASLQGQQIKAQHFHDVRTAINSVRAIGNLTAATWARSNLLGLEVLASDVNELRTKLDEALTALSIPVTAYTDSTLQTGASGTLIKGTHIQELQTRSTKGSSTSFGPIDSDSATSRLDPMNETGGGSENPLSRNFNWNLPLVNLPGRAGMNLGLTLSYNSLVWTKSGNTISFDDDYGFPAPGFRLGFPVIQQIYYNTEVGKLAFMMISPDGSRTELRQVGATDLYEAADSSYLLLDADAMVLRTKDGTQFKYVLMGSEFNCTQIKDRNGNYITVNYTGSGRIDTVVDTLARSIKFNYDANGWLTSITQIWNQGQPSQVTHNWARFEYANISIDYNFGSMTVFGLADNSTLKMLSRVKLADDSYFDFTYSNWGQVWKVTNYAPDNSPLNYRSYNLPTTTGQHDDCPRFTSRKDWAKYWNGDTDGTMASNEEVATSFIVPASDTWTMPDSSQQSGTRAEVTMPDGTLHKIYYIGSAGTSSGWRRGLPALVETHSGGTWQRKTMTTWTQDNTAVSYKLNPRVSETNVYDPQGNRARTETTYQQFNFANGTSCHLPIDSYEYAANATTKLRSTRTDYNTSSTYTNRRIIGLVSEVRVYEGEVTGPLVSKVASIYDESGSIQGTDAPVQHDNTDYTASFLAGRANLSSVKRFDVDNTSLFVTMKRKYNTAGAVVSSKDGLDHEVTISYADSFSDGNNTRNTLANATTMTDPDGYTTTLKYNFDFGSTTYKRTPQPDVVTNTPGPEQSFTFDTLGRAQQITNLVNNSYTRFEYPSHSRVDTYATIQEGAGEAHSFKITDGVGRVVATAQDHPGSTGGFSGRKIIYDVMGRQFKTSNPTETTASGAPSQWNTVGDDSAASWIYVQQTFDWKGRPLVTTNQDGTTRIASYSGCGCAGGEVTTLTDEGSIDAGGVTNKRQQKTYADVLGRIVKSEILNWQAGSVYAATVSTYNARNQLMQMTQYAGPAGSSTHQETTFDYDGHGRLKTKHTPEQGENKFTSWTYNADDSFNVITDPRGATSTFTYNNNRKLVNTATYELAGKPTIAVSYTYDAIGNIKSITDPSGSTSYSYNSVGKIASETRQLTGISGQSFTMAYQYNLGGELKTFTLPTQFGTTVYYAFDRAGRLTGVTNTGYTYSDPNIIETAVEVPLPTFLSNVSYRAWNDVKSMDDGDGVHIEYNYNSRLLPTSYAVSDLFQNGSLSWNYTYHPDARIRVASDVADSNFDRKYEYDQVGRLKEAYSGREARGESPSSPTPDSPYRQTTVYNEFGNRLQQTGRIWQKNLSGDLFAYSNNRRVGLTYDEAGRVIEDLQGIHVFDSQGQRSLVTAGTVGGGETGSPEVPASESSTVYDGRGFPAAITSTTRAEELIGEGPLANISTGSATVFYLKSTVLNAVIAELNSAGQRSKEYVYAGGQRLATWDITPWNDGIEWHHKNPMTGSWISIWAPFNSAIRTEVDPSGRVTGNEPFFIPPDPPEPPQTRETFYLIEGGPTIEAELGMQLYEDRYINRVFGDQAGPGEGPYTGDNWIRWSQEREFQLMTGERFLFGIDEINANLPGSFEWVSETHQWDDGSKARENPDGSWSVPSLIPIEVGYFRLVPGSGDPQKRSDLGPADKQIKVPKVDVPTRLSDCVKNLLSPYFPGTDLNKVSIQFGFPTPNLIAGSFLNFVGIQTLNNATAIVMGNTIYFRSREDYNPDSIGGISLIAHEVKHVEQFQSGRMSVIDYIAQYQKWRSAGKSDYDAYQSISYEHEGFDIQNNVYSDLEYRRDKEGGDAFWSPCPPR